MEEGWPGATGLTTHGTTDPAPVRVNGDICSTSWVVTPVTRWGRRRTWRSHATRAHAPWTEPGAVTPFQCSVCTHVRRRAIHGPAATSADENAIVCRTSHSPRATRSSRHDARARSGRRGPNPTRRTGSLMVLAGRGAGAPETDVNHPDVVTRVADGPHVLEDEWRPARVLRVRKPRRDHEHAHGPDASRATRERRDSRARRSATSWVDELDPLGFDDSVAALPR